MVVEIVALAIVVINIPVVSVEVRIVIREKIGKRKKKEK